MWANFAWLLGIVFLPFPTELIGTRGVKDSSAAALYIGTLAFTTAAATAQQLILARKPELQHEEVRGGVAVVGSVISTGAMLLALLISVVVPSVGLWSLLLLVLADPITGLINRRRRVAT